MNRHYHYVGPPEIADRVAGSGGLLIESTEDLSASLRSLDASIQSGESFTVTFVIDLDGRLRIADRRSEHVMCAGGKPVLSAGEMAFSTDDGVIFVERVTNQSTGYCPEPESWSAVAEALDRLSLRGPECFDPAFIFRRCPSCLQINIVKDEWYLGAALFVWTFQTLGKNLTDTVVTRKEHTLVTTGPYRYVRHPFYLAFLVAVIGGSIVTANWFLFVTSLLPFSFIVARTRIEEEKLVERFGDEYRDYMAKTGRFWPRLRLR